MLEINNGSSPEDENKRLKEIDTEPGDPNSPVVPSPGQTEPHFHDLTPGELAAVSGGWIRGVAAEIPAQIGVELAANGITNGDVARMAARWGVRAAQAGAILLSRVVSAKMNNSIAVLTGGSGGSNGNPPFVTFHPANDSDGGSGATGGSGSGGGSGFSGGSSYSHPALENHLDMNGKPGEVTECRFSC